MINGKVVLEWLGLRFELPMERMKELVECWDDWDDLDVLTFLCGIDCPDTVNTDLSSLFREHYEVERKQKKRRGRPKKVEYDEED